MTSRAGQRRVYRPSSPEPDYDPLRDLFSRAPTRGFAACGLVPRSRCSFEALELVVGTRITRSSISGTTRYRSNWAQCLRSSRRPISMRHCPASVLARNAAPTRSRYVSSRAAEPASLSSISRCPSSGCPSRRRLIRVPARSASSAANVPPSAHHHQLLAARNRVDHGVEVQNATSQHMIGVLGHQKRGGSKSFTYPTRSRQSLRTPQLSLNIVQTVIRLHLRQRPPPGRAGVALHHPPTSDI